ncbi:sugar ABC transporter permease [Limnochorda sp.]|uniref:sugar ABC transporter permease n=1 Tax=Limnochorda sp. TaxID=1940279 RepID=UPI0039C313DD
MATDGVFLAPRNMSNLFRQTTIIGLLAIGMTFVITAGHIDLSVGSLTGLAGAIAAMMQVRWLPALAQAWGVAWLQESWVISVIAILAALLVGLLVGLWHGVWTAYGGVPAFIATLGGLLIFRGSILGITRGVNIGPMEPLFRSLGQSYLSTGAGVALAAVTVAAIFLMTFRARRERIRHGLPVHAAWMDGAAAALYSALAILFVVVMNRYRGIPVPVIILIIAAMIFTFIYRRTQLGRYTWAIGGNLEAAKLSGVNVRRVTVQIFALMGLLAGLAGVILTARLNAATANAGNGFELDAIAACVMGGTSLAGGYGSIPGALLGALIMASVDNGLSMLNVESFWQQIIKGFILMVAVLIDVRSRRAKRA